MAASVSVRRRKTFQRGLIHRAWPRSSLLRSPRSGPGSGLAHGPPLRSLRGSLCVPLPAQSQAGAGEREPLGPGRAADGHPAGGGGLPRDLRLPGGPHGPPAAEVSLAFCCCFGFFFARQILNESLCFPASPRGRLPPRPSRGPPSPALPAPCRPPPTAAAAPRPGGFHATGGDIQNQLTAFGLIRGGGPSSSCKNDNSSAEGGGDGQDCGAVSLFFLFFVFHERKNSNRTKVRLGTVCERLRFELAQLRA